MGQEHATQFQPQPTGIIYECSLETYAPCGFPAVEPFDSDLFIYELIKVKNSRYSQLEGREELFDRA